MFIHARVALTDFIYFVVSPVLNHAYKRVFEGRTIADDVHHAHTTASDFQHPCGCVVYELRDWHRHTAAGPSSEGWSFTHKRSASPQEHGFVCLLSVYPCRLMRPPRFSRSRATHAPTHARIFVGGHRCLCEGRKEYLRCQQRAVCRTGIACMRVCVGSCTSIKYIMRH